jgi:hypothetical protein
MSSYCTCFWNAEKSECNEQIEDCDEKVYIYMPQRASKAGGRQRKHIGMFGADFEFSHTAYILKMLTFRLPRSFVQSKQSQRSHRKTQRYRQSGLRSLEQTNAHMISILEILEQREVERDKEVDRHNILCFIHRPGNTIRANKLSANTESKKMYSASS